MINKNVAARVFHVMTIISGVLTLFMTVKASDAEFIGPYMLLLGLAAGSAMLLIGAGWKKMLSIIGAVISWLYTVGINIGRRIRVKGPYRRKTLRHAGGFSVSRESAVIASDQDREYDLLCYPKCS